MHKIAKFLRTVFWSKYTVRTLGVAVALFILINVALFVVFRNKTYPGTTVGGHGFGSITTSAISKELTKKPLLPANITLKFDTQLIRVSPQAIGLKVDSNALEQHIAKRHWLPVMNLMRPPQIALEVSADQKTLQKKLTDVTKTYAQPAADAHIAIENGWFTLVPAKVSKQLDMAQSVEHIVQGVAKGDDTVALVVKSEKPRIGDQQLQPAVDALRAAQNVPINFVFDGKSAKPSPADIAAWYVNQDGNYVLSDAAIRAFVQKSGASFGISVANMDTVIKTVRTSLDKRQPATITLTAAPKATKTFTYCIQAKDVDASNLPAFRSKLASVYADPRGWSVNGKIAFQEVSAGCDFRVWLSASSQLPSFGAICDTTWSCTVKPHVIINFDRWRYASDVWNAARGSLDDYRSMVINHETGHLLGFGHKFCGGAGQAAPVMQQQSISLQGCVFSPWPLPLEQQQLLGTYGIR